MDAAEQPDAILSDAAMFRGLLALRRELNRKYVLRSRLELDIERGEHLFRTRVDLLIAGLQPLRKPGDEGLVVIKTAELLEPTLDDTIKEALISALDAAQGKRARVAQLLGVPRSRVYRLMARYQLD